AAAGRGEWWVPRQTRTRRATRTDACRPRIEFVNNLRAIGRSVASVLCPCSSDYSPPRGGRVRSIFVVAVVLALIACGACEVQRADPGLTRLLADREAVWRAWVEDD